MSVVIHGERSSGQDVRSGNVSALMSVANVLRSSLGPQGLDKMIVDDIGDVLVTNDGATILKKLEILHPAAKLLVELSDLQDREVGDGTTSVVLLAAELCKAGNHIIQQGIHPTNVIAGFKLAMKESVKYVQNKLSLKLDHSKKDLLLNVAATTINSKFIGADSPHFSNLVVQAVQTVKMVNERGETKYPVGAINVIKTHGKSMHDSVLVEGYALKAGRAAQGMPHHIKGAKIALLDFGLKQHRMQLGVTIQCDNPEDLEKIRQKEKDICKEKIQKILASGADVILTTQGIDDLSLKYFVEKKCIALRRIDRKDMKRIAKITGGQMCLTMATLDGDEKFDSSMLGHCDEVYEERVGDWDHIMFKGCKASKAATILLRGANEFMLDEVERSVHDALCAVSRTLESSAVCPGGGAVEAALSVYLEDFARTLGSREQVAIAAFAEALLVIPKTLSVNAAQDASELLAKLRSIHCLSQRSEDGGEYFSGSPSASSSVSSSSSSPSSSVDKKDLENYKYYGLDLIRGTVRNNLHAGVVEATISKVKALRFATEAAVTILRIDDMIKIAPEPEPQRR